MGGDGHVNVADGVALGGTENGCAKRRAVIGSRRLDKNVIQNAGFDKLSIGGAVEGHSSGQGKPPQASAPSERSTDMEHDTIETILKGGSHISVITGDFDIWFARLNQMLCEVLAGGQVSLGLVL